MERPFDERTYGRSFADVYDSWYPESPDSVGAVEFVAGLCEPGGRIMELGIGTGRVALPLLQAGYRVSGIDSSPEMLTLLESKVATSTSRTADSLNGGLSLDVHCGDAASDGSWPEGPFEVVVAAFNFMFNLIGDESKRRVMQSSAKRLAPGGSLLVECSVPLSVSEDGEDDVPQVPERSLEVRSVAPDSVVLIATSASHETGIVIGQHIELRDGEPVRLRPWRVHVMTPEDTDAMAESCGLRLLERFGGWAGECFDQDSTRSVSRYVRKDE